MDSIARQDQERALRAVAFWCMSQAQGIELEESVTESLGFGSVEAMHKQLTNWGLPDWITGDVPKSSEPDKPTRRGQTTTEEPTELPPAHSAALLFYQALQKLNRAIGDLDNRKEYLQNGRFVAQEDTAQGDWPEMGIEDGTLTVPLGGQQTPLEPLPALIAAYILADEPLEPLLEKLNTRPETVDKEQIQALIEGKKTSKGHVRGLKSVAGLIARGVRGGEIRGGPTTGEFSTKIQNGVWYSQQLAQRGFTAKAIFERLKEADFSPSEISQVRKLNKLPQPE
jgi:hypothetical protein